MTGRAGEPPIGISGSGRYFVDSVGRPFFWLGDTEWNLWRCHTAAEATEILARRKEEGFSVIHVMLSGWGAGMGGDPVFRVGTPPVHGEAYPERDPLRPSEPFFRHVDAVMEQAERLGLVLAVGLDHPRLRLGTTANARAWGRWVGARYRARCGIVWVASYTIPNASHLPVTREIAAGLAEGGSPTGLCSCHPDPADPFCTSGVAHAEPWLAFNTIQTWKRYDCIVDAVTVDYRREPAKPVVMAEGAYEAGEEYGFPITPHLLRKQAYWSYLSGGHHSYGHNDNWQVGPGWRRSLEAPGAAQMGVCRSLLERVSWWELVPDQSLLDDDPGRGAGLRVAARSTDGSWIMVYLPEPGSIRIRLPEAMADRGAVFSWADPRDGRIVARGGHRGSPLYAGETPAGLEDALLSVQLV